MHPLLSLSHSFTVLSSLDEAMRRLSGENFAHRTQLVCPLIVNWYFCLCTIQTCMGMYILLKIKMTIKGVLKASRIKILNKPAQWYQAESDLNRH